MSNSALARYDDLGEYAGRDVVVVVPRPASVYTLAAIAVVNTITGQVQYSTVQYSTVQYSTPSPARCWAASPCPAQRSSSHTQSRPASARTPSGGRTAPRPPGISTYLQYLHKYLHLQPLARLPPSTVQYSTHHPVYPTQPTPPPKLYALPNCREFLGRRIR